MCSSFTSFCDLNTKLLRSVSKPSKYYTWYLAICQRAADRAGTRWRAKQLLGYVEGHHMLPQSVFPDERDNPNNVVFLTAREHFICHWLASKMFEGVNKSKMVHALLLFTNYNRYMSRAGCSRSFDRVKNSTHMIVKQIGPLNKGSTHSPETRQRLSTINAGKVLSRDTKHKMSVRKQGANNWMYGKTHSEQTRLSISKAVKGRTAHNKGKPMNADVKCAMSNTKRSASIKYNVYRNGELCGCMSAIEFCEQHGYKYGNAAGSIKNKHKYFDWTFDPVQ